MGKRTTKKPHWASDYFTAALDNLERLQSVIELSLQGISTIPAVPRVVELLEQGPDKLREARRRAELAQAEIDRGFSTLIGFGVVALWSWLETFVVDFVVLSIQRRPAFLATLKAPKVRIDLAEYAQMRGRERARFITDAVDRELGGPLRNGMGRFDGLLEAIGINVPLEDHYRRDLFELQQVRNCLSHRFGVVDARLATACPWLTLKQGQSLSVSYRDFVRYGGACGRYLLLLLYEVGDVLGIDYRSAGEAKAAAHVAEEGAEQGSAPS
jgi:hypothetical protein